MHVAAGLAMQGGQARQRRIGHGVAVIEISCEGPGIEGRAGVIYVGDGHAGAFPTAIRTKGLHPYGVLMVRSR
jgi:hypothetical protein